MAMETLAPTAVQYSSAGTHALSSSGNAFCHPGWSRECLGDARNGTAHGLVPNSMGHACLSSSHFFYGSDGPVNGSNRAQHQGMQHPVFSSSDFRQPIQRVQLSAGAWCVQRRPAKREALSSAAVWSSTTTYEASYNDLLESQTNGHKDQLESVNTHEAEPAELTTGDDYLKELLGEDSDEPSAVLNGTNLPQHGWVDFCRVCKLRTGQTLYTCGVSLHVCSRCQRRLRALTRQSDLADVEQSATLQQLFHLDTAALQTWSAASGLSYEERVALVQHALVTADRGLKQALGQLN